MHLHQGGFRKILAVAVCLLLLQQPALAITPNDIRGYYGLALQQDIRPLQAELQQVAKTIRTAEDIEAYNKVLSSYPLKALEREITERTTDLQMTTKTLTTGVDLSLEDMIALESKYYTDRDELNLLLQSYDTVASLPLEAQHEDLDALYESAEDL